MGDLAVTNDRIGLDRPPHGKPPPFATLNDFTGDLGRVSRSESWYYPLVCFTSFRRPTTSGGVVAPLYASTFE